MNKVTHYTVVGSTLKEDMELEIEGLLSDGWQPWGDLNVVYDRKGDRFLLVQAMVKYEVRTEGFMSG